MARKPKDQTQAQTQAQTTPHQGDTMNMNTSNTSNTSTNKNMSLKELACANAAQAHAQANQANHASTPNSVSCFERFLEIGKAYFIFTQGFYYIGRLIDMDAEGMVLSECVWVTYTGPISDMIRSGELMTAVPMKNEAYMPRIRIDTIFEWKHEIPVNPIDK